MALSLSIGLGIALGLGIVYVYRALFCVKDDEARKTVLLFALAELDREDPGPHDGFEVYGLPFWGALLPWFADGSAGRLFRELVKSGLIAPSPGSPRPSSFPEWFVARKRHAYALTDAGRTHLRELREKTRKEMHIWSGAHMASVEAYRA